MHVKGMTTYQLMNEISSYQSALEEVTQVEDFKKLCNELVYRINLMTERVGLLSELL